ncbi:MAG TPA: DegT/DnrJ/EryC1/StrS family aminotransferase [Phycisphaerae bacterium]|nr:DegT/DnrJ/EryC1/StrS family aminotransferase [Phycisphaerae bacterium]
MDIPLSQPDIGQQEIDAVLEVLRSRRLALGPVREDFERAVADYIGTTQAVAVSSGTAALHLALAALEIGPGDEVITTPFSFVASANVILYQQARPVFVDIDPVSWAIDVDRIEAAITPRTRAILPVHVFGQTCPMDRIMSIADRHGLAVIEDACEALGGAYRGKRAGSFGQFGTFAFYPNKQITTGEGGMVVTSDPELAALVRSLHNQGRDDSGQWLQHARLGYNYRITEMSCGLGLAQMRRVDELLGNRAAVARMYQQRLAGDPRVTMIQPGPDVQMSWFVMVVKLADSYTPQDRQRVLSVLRERGIGCGDYFPAIHLQPVYRQRLGLGPGDFAICESVADRTLALPFHGRMTEQQVDAVCQTLLGLL